MPFPTALDTALQADGPLVFYAVEIVLNSGDTIRLLDGSGMVTIGGNAYAGDDATYGTVQAISAFTDGAGDQSPHVVVTLLPPTNAAASTLCAAANQGSAVTLYFGAIDRVTGALIGTADTCFSGELDVGKLIVGKVEGGGAYRRVELDIASVWDRFFDVEEGVQLNNAYHQSIWPGELGLAYVTTTQYQIPWGSDAARPNIIADGQTDRGTTQSALLYLIHRLFL